MAPSDMGPGVSDPWESRNRHEKCSAEVRSWLSWNHRKRGTTQGGGGPDRNRFETQCSMGPHWVRFLFSGKPVWIRITESNSTIVFSEYQRVRKAREGWNCRFQKTPRTEGGDKAQAGSTQGSRQVCLSRCLNPRICSISRFGKNFPAIFLGLCRSFPRAPPNKPRKQPQTFRVF